MQRHKKGFVQGTTVEIQNFKKPEQKDTPEKKINK